MPVAGETGAGSQGTDASVVGVQPPTAASAGAGVVPEVVLTPDGEGGTPPTAALPTPPAPQPAKEPEFDPDLLALGSAVGMTEEEMKEAGPAVVKFTLRQLERQHLKRETEESPAGSESPAERTPQKAKEKEPEPKPEPADEDDDSFDKRFKDFEPELVKELQTGRRAARELRELKTQLEGILPEVHEMRRERQHRMVREIEAIADEVGKDFADQIGTGDRRGLTGDQRVQWFSVLKVMDQLAPIYPGLDRKVLFKRALVAHFSDHPRKSSTETKPPSASSKTPLARPGSAIATPLNMDPTEAATLRFKVAREAKGLKPLNGD